MFSSILSHIGDINLLNKVFCFWQRRHWGYHEPVFDGFRKENEAVEFRWVIDVVLFIEHYVSASDDLFLRWDPDAKDVCTLVAYQVSYEGARIEAL